jgi:hypothetical protein
MNLGKTKKTQTVRLLILSLSITLITLPVGAQTRSLSPKARLCEQFAQAQLQKAGINSNGNMKATSKYDEASGFCTARIQQQPEKGQEQEAAATYIRTNQFDPSSTLTQNRTPPRTAEWSTDALPNTSVTCKHNIPQSDGTSLCIPAETRNSDILKPTFRLDKGL